MARIVILYLLQKISICFKDALGKAGKGEQKSHSRVLSPLGKLI